MRNYVSRLERRIGTYYMPLMLVVMTIVLFIIGYPSIQPSNVSVTLNTVATQTIRAPRTTEDTEATTRARDTAANNVQNVYVKNESIATDQLAIVNRFFETIANYRRELAQAQTNGENISEKKSELIARFYNSLSDENESLHSYAISFSDSLIDTLLSATETDYSRYEALTKQALEEILQEDIYESATDIAKYRTQANTLVVSRIYTEVGRATVSELVNAGIVANMQINEEATQAAKDVAKAAVAPVVITQGEVIVREGEVIGSSAYRRLQLLGMTEDSYDIHKLLGYSIVLLVQVLVVWLYLSKEASVSKRNHYINLYTFFMIVMSLLAYAGDLIQSAGADYFAMMVPIAIIPILMIPKAKRRLSILAILFLMLLYFFMGYSGDAVQVPLTWHFTMLLGMFTTVIVSGHKQRRLRRLLGLLVLISVALTTVLALYYGIGIPSNSYYTLVLYALLNVIFTVGVARFSRPYFDLMFEDTAVLRMMELSNPSQPLLKELIEKAPGTYHHSVMVANLSANAVEAIGGDSLFARVACYYHDVGKLKSPMYFVENLPVGMENPHDLLTPQESRDIIFAHVTDGVAMLEKAGMPKDIIDICRQHHGTTAVKYFYIKAKEADDSVEMDDFRYKGETPTTKESAVISIADTVESATRAMKTPNVDSITKLVRETIQSRIEDGQFDNCPITIKELKIVEESLIKGLTGSYHTRVPYPKLKK